MFTASDNTFIKGYKVISLNSFFTDVSTVTPTPAPATAATGGESNSTMSRLF